MTIPFGQGVCPFYTVVPIDGMDGVFRPFGNARIGKIVPVGDGPGVDFVPKGLGHFVLVDGKGGEGNFMTRVARRIINPVNPGRNDRHFDGNRDRLTGYSAVRIGYINHILAGIRPGGIFKG